MNLDLANVWSQCIIDQVCERETNNYQVKVVQVSQRQEAANIIVEFYDNVGLAATGEFEYERDRSLPLPSVYGCGYIYRHV